jgi:hypothetical protein
MNHLRLLNAHYGQTAWHMAAAVHVELLEKLWDWAKGL